MARTVYFADGTHELLFCGDYDTDKKAEALERILRERLGDDSAGLFREIMQDHKETVTALEDEMRSYEGSCEAYLACLQDIQSDVMAATLLLNGRKKLSVALAALQTKINNELYGGKQL